MLSDELKLLPAPESVKLFSGEFVLDLPVRIEGEPSFPGIAEAVLGKECIPGSGGIRFRTDPAFADEAYSLTVARDGVSVVARDLRGGRWALCTLAQILERCGTRLPCLEIRDAPKFKVRGAMLDVTRGRVWTLDHLKDTIRKLASWKMNLVQLYFEHAFASKGNEEVWKDSSPVTPEEMRELDAFAADLGVELCACQNSFGHLTLFLLHDQYRPLAEIQPGMNFDSWGRLSGIPQSLAPDDPKALDFVRNLYESLLPNYSSKWINIGCDETLDLGFGRSRRKAAEIGLENVFAGFVSKLCAIVREMGRRPMMWADMPLRYPEIIEKLPPDLTYLLWGYDSNTPFAEWCGILKKTNREYWVCPGTCNWSSFLGDSTRRRENLKIAASAGIAGGASGYLVTDWGDGGHRQCWGPSLLGLAEAAHRAWSGLAPYSPDAAGLRAFGSERAAWWFEAAGDVDLSIKKAGIPGLYADFHLPWHQLDARATPAQAVYFRLARNAVRTLRDDIPADAPELLKREMKFAADFAGLAAERAVLRRESRVAELKELGRKMRPLIREFRELWLERSRPGGLDASAGKWEAAADELERIY